MDLGKKIKLSTNSEGKAVVSEETNAGLFDVIQHAFGMHGSGTVLTGTANFLATATTAVVAVLGTSKFTTDQWIPRRPALIGLQ